MKKNQTRRALLMSALSLLLCVSMLVGTTFAWFTDSVVSGTNTIAAGNLDVELYHGKDANPVDKVNERTLLFTDAGGNVIDLWEPGVVAFTNLKVANVGTLALKYQLSVNSTNMNYFLDENGVQHTLAEALKVAVIEGGVSGTREEVVAAASNWTWLKSFTLPGVLEGNTTSQTYGIVIYWEPGNNEYDNLFNMNNGKQTNDGNPLNITLGVNLFATQEMYEDDSFGPDYDENAWVDGFDVYNEQDLNAAIANGETAIDLGNDIALTKTFEIPAGAKLTLNLNGKTLTGPGQDDEGNKVHALTNNGSLELVGGTVKSEAANGGSAIYNAAGATLTLEDVTVVGAPQEGNKWPSYAINSYGNLTINGADITSTHGAIAVYGDTVINDANVTMNGFGGSSHVFYIGGDGTDLIVNGGTYTHKGNVDGSLAYIMTGTTMTVNGGTFTASNGGYGLATYTGSLTVNGGTFANAFLDWGGPISIAGGTFATKPADKYIAAGYTAVDNGDGTWTVGACKVSTGAELVDAIANGKAVELTQDINLGKIDLTDAITNDVVINANGHKITTTDAYGIEVTAGKNVTISNADVVMTKEGDYITYAAGFKIANGDYAGATITLENCTITMANTDWAYAVNMPASVKNLNLVIDNCTLEGAIAVQCWGDNNTVTITNSKLICNYTTNAMYTSYCVVLQDDGYNMAENNTFVIDNCEFLYSGIDNFNSVIKAVDDVGSENNTITVTNCTYGEKVVAG